MLMDGLLFLAIYILYLFVISTAAAIIQLILNTKMFSKANRSWWKSLIPIYNYYVLCQIAYDEADGPNWNFWLCLIPIFGFFQTIRNLYNLFKSFSFSDGQAAAFTFSPFIIGLILSVFAVLPYSNDTIEIAVLFGIPFALEALVLTPYFMMASKTKYPYIYGTNADITGLPGMGLPGTPVANPTAPVAQPVTPVTQPIAQPVTPATQPTTPAAQPATPNQPAQGSSSSNPLLP